MQSAPDAPLSYLFGGDRPWDPAAWTATDDRVRGGASHSYLTPLGPGRVRFHGNLDTSVLGGAGFASQRTVGIHHRWDLLHGRRHDGPVALVLDLSRADARKYTLTLKDDIPPRRPDGREQSAVSWEYDFVVPDNDRNGNGNGKDNDVDNGAPATTRHRVLMPLAHFKPTYRGKPKPDAQPLDVRNIKRISFMMRSHFGEQCGEFSLEIKSLGVTTTTTTNSSPSSAAVAVAVRDGSLDSVDSAPLKQPYVVSETELGDRPVVGWFSWLSRCFGSRM